MSSSDTSTVASGDPSSLIGSLVADRFRLEALSSTGANTSIFVATDQQAGRVVTVKLLRPALAASPRFRTDFDETMRGVAALSHPNIAAVYDWGVAAVGNTSTAYVVTEHLTGGSLRDMFDRGRRLSPSQALAVGLEACRALDHAHRRGFVHTELTPSKLVFGDDRRLRIVDFGLARLLGAPQWEQPESVDNHVAWYSAPELGLRRQVDGAADVYSLCLTLHEGVTGTLPFKSDSTVASLAARVGKLMPVSADLGPLASVFERAGRPEADERSTAAEFGKALVQAASKLSRPEPLPLLSSGLFETPTERLRAPEDPTGGVTRPSPVTSGPAGVTEPATPPAPDDLVILPLDADPRPGIVDPQTTGESTVVADVSVDGPGRIAETRPMPTVPSAAPVVSRPHRSVRGKMALALGVVVALVALGFLATRLFATPVYTVPDLTGLPRAEALNLIATNDWIVQETQSPSDEIPLVDHVVSTTPAAGAELAEGEPFLIVVSTGPVPRELPESRGATLADAQTRLIGLDLQVSVTEAYDETVPSGVIVSWSVPIDPTLVAGGTVAPETLVDLVVSKGPAPRTVPDLVGSSAADARAAIDELLLEFVQAPDEFSDEVPAGDVIRQEPAPGTEVERGTEVIVVVSKGVDLVVFPDLGETPVFEEAAVVLAEAGFDARLRFGDAQGVIRELTIDGDEPSVGDTFPRGTVVDISAL